MNWYQKYKLAGFTSQRNFDRISPRDSDIEPLTDKERTRLVKLIKKVDKSGSPSVLTEKELKEYEELGTRSNLQDAQIQTTSLPTAIRPWITQ